MPLPKLGVAQLSPKWAWAGGHLFALQGDATEASFGVARFAGAGGGLEQAGMAADRCVAAALHTTSTAVTIPDVPTPAASIVHVSGALNGTIRGPINCVGAQANGTYPLGSSRLALEVSTRGVEATVIRPPGGAPLWIFLPKPIDSADGVRPGSHAITFATEIPNQPTQHTPGRAATAGLRLDGTLACS